MKHFKTILIVLLAALTAAGCFEKKTLSVNDDSAPQIPQLIIFTGPGSANAPQDLVASISHLNGQTATGFNFLSLATVSSPVVDGLTSTWEVNYGDLSAIIHAEKTGDDSVEWTITVHGATSSVSYNNWIAMRGVAAIDGSEGDWSIFSENSTVKSAEFSWHVNVDNVRSGTLALASENVSYAVTNNPDHSGSLIILEGTIKVYEAIWDATGAGSWSSWSSDGALTASGSWD